MNKHIFVFSFSNLEQKIIYKIKYNKKNNCFKILKVNSMLNKKY